MASKSATEAMETEELDENTRKCIGLLHLPYIEEDVTDSVDYPWDRLVEELKKTEKTIYNRYPNFINRNIYTFCVNENTAEDSEKDSVAWYTPLYTNKDKENIIDVMSTDGESGSRIDTIQCVKYMSPYGEVVNRFINQEVEPQEVVIDSSQKWSAFLQTRSIRFVKLPITKIFESDADLNLPRLPKLDPNIIYNLTKEQEDFVKEIQMTLDTRKRLTTFAITGRAGTGKAYILGPLQQIANVLYMSVTATLVHATKKTYPVHCAATIASTCCKLTQMPPKSFMFDLKPLLDLNKFEDVEKAFHKMLEEINSDFLISKRVLTDVKIIFLDEFTLCSAGLIRFIQILLEEYAEIHNECLILILSGDPNQNPPIKCISENNSKIILDSLVDRQLNFTTMIKYSNDKFQQFVSEIRLTTNTNEIKRKTNTFFSLQRDDTDHVTVDCFYPVDDPIPDLKFGQFNWDNVKFPVNDKNVPVRPLNEITDDTNIVNHKEVADWLMRYAAKINGFKILTPRNVTIHKLSLIYAMALEKAGVKVFYSKIYSVVSNQFNDCYKLIDNTSSENTKELVPLLPLVVGCEYIYLQRGAIIPYGTTVSLLAVCDDYLVMYDQDGVKFKIYPNFYYMSIFHQRMYGYPLELNCIQNIYKCQGHTIKDKYVYLILDGASSNNMYVALSRCTDENYIKHVSF